MVRKFYLIGAIYTCPLCDGLEIDGRCSACRVSLRELMVATARADYFDRIEPAALRRPRVEARTRMHHILRRNYAWEALS